MAENNSESVDVDPQSNTDTPGMVTGSRCSLGLGMGCVRAGGCRLLDLECLKLKRRQWIHSRNDRRARDNCRA